MIEPFAAAWEVGDFFAEHDLPYALIGGLAVQVWGNARLTADADLSVASPLITGSAPLVRLITERFPSRSADPVGFAGQTRMVLITASNGVEVDISLALPGYEDQLFARAVDYEIEPGKVIRLCSAEDLIIHKAVAGRPQDLSDIQGVVDRRGVKLNVAYIRQWLRDFADALANPEVVERFESAWRER
ncbi:MAG: nucleotidyltransferase [Chloroflexi bacterium]|nr:nucleotidyltransferase [Chloroflexota bacterium]